MVFIYSVIWFRSNVPVSKYLVLLFFIYWSCEMGLRTQLNLFWPKMLDHSLAINLANISQQAIVTLRGMAEQCE